MKRILKSALYLLLATTLVVACSNDEPQPTHPAPTPETPQPLTESHTLLIYMQGNNGLAEFMDSNLQRIISAYYNIDNDNARVFIFYDRGNYTRLTELYMNDGMAKQRLIEEYTTSTSTVDKDFMAAVFAQVKELAPADSYGLILSSHGGGWVPADLYDVYLIGEGSRAEEPQASPLFYGQDDYDCMEIPDLVDAINAMHFNYIIFDACFMGNVEALYDMRSSADYIIASPAEVLGAGFPYETMLPMLFEYEGHQLEEICEEYMAYYEGSSATVTLVDCAKFDALAAAMHKVIATGNEANVDIDALQAFDNFDAHLYLDLGHYVEQIATDEALKAFNKALKEVVIFTDHTSSLFTSTGSVETIAVERSSGFTTYVKQDGCPVTYAEWLKTAWAKAIGAK